MVRDGAAHGEALVETKREGHRRLAGRPILGVWEGGARTESGNCQNPESACGMWRLRLMAHLKYERDAEKGLEQPGR